MNAAKKQNKNQAQIAWQLWNKIDELSKILLDIYYDEFTDFAQMAIHETEKKENEKSARDLGAY